MLPARLRDTFEVLDEIELDDVHEDNRNSSNVGDLFDSLVVLEFSSRAPPPAVQFIVDKISSSKSHGGSDLQVCSILDEHREITKVHVSATVEKLLASAELMEMKKLYRDGSMRDLCTADISNYNNSGDLSNFLTTAEKQRIILHDLESIRALPSDFHVPGMPTVRLYSGEAIIPRCIEENVISNCFALHNRTEILRLSSAWYKAIFSTQPIDEVRSYFGETIAMYFAFLGHYAYYLFLPAIFGLVWEFLISSSHQDVGIICFSIFNLVWTTIFLESWKRRTAELSYQWGTMNMELFEEPRASFYGEVGSDPVTGRLQPQYSSTIRLLKIYFVSVPVMAIAFVIAFVVTMCYFRFEELMVPYTKDNSIKSTILSLVPSIANTVVLIILGYIYHWIAVTLNDWENHRLQSAHENHLVTKLALFNFANNFLFLFYIAFYLQDMHALRSNLATLLILTQLVEQLKEALIPFLSYKWRKVTIKTSHVDQNAECISRQVLLRAEIESVKDDYRSTLEDYLELFLQFGYVFFFSSVFPMAAFWALVNNLFEIRTDAFKLCRTARRPFARPTANIGVWQTAFEVMGVIAVMTNCTLVALSTRFKGYSNTYGSVKVALAFVAVEHVILFVKVGIAYLIPDVPESIATSLAAAEYRMKQTSKRLRCRVAQ